MAWEAAVDVVEPNDQPVVDQQVADICCFVQRSKFAERLDILGDSGWARMAVADPGIAEPLVLEGLRV